MFSATKIEDRQTGNPANVLNRAGFAGGSNS